MVEIPKHIEAFWKSFLDSQSAPTDANERFYESFRVGSDEEDADKGARLILSGQKTATSSLLWEYDDGGKPLPTVGALSVVEDGGRKPVCVVETTWMMRKLIISITISCFCVVTVWALFAVHLEAQSAYPFVPSDFEVPENLETEKFLLRTLTVNDVVKDYDAVMTSVARLKTVFGRNTDWPTDLTFEQDLIDLGWHQREFQRRTSFAYTVMNPTESECIGCIYINPTRKQGYDAVVYLWVRDSEFEKGLDPILFDAVKEWVANDWPFQKVAYPDRTVDWESWEAIPELPR